ncbi:TraB/GumN family protein [Aliidiomarina indica]|uniref:TraB/GumN family protein n=1 Tax=Aliidiomarina indica TaxID=2749147 RepID=UPI00188F56E8
MSSLWLAMAALWVLLSAPAQAEISYLVQRDHETYVIVGTIHMGSGPDTRLQSDTLAHLCSSNQVYLELARSELSGVLLRMMREGRRNGPSLSETLGSELWAEFSAFTQSYGIPGAQIDDLEMWLISMLLTPQMATKAGFSSEYGIETKLYAAIARANIKERGLERVDDQLAAIRKALASSTDVELARGLMDEGESATAELRALELAWRAGDLDALMEAIDASSDSMELAWLLDQRNVAWFEYLQETYAGSDTPTKLFIAVGAGHLGGDTGLLKLFADAGYQVTPLHQ